MSEEKHYYGRVTMALDDLLKAKRYAEQMLTLPKGAPYTSEGTIHEALHVALIISYARVFTASYTVDEQYNKSVKERFKKLQEEMISDLSKRHLLFHERLIEKRHSAIAHSDAKSRNYQYYNDSALAVGRNPYVAYDIDEIKIALQLIGQFIVVVGEEQSMVGNSAFDKPVFKSK